LKQVFGPLVNIRSKGGVLFGSLSLFKATSIEKLNPKFLVQEGHGTQTDSEYARGKKRYLCEYSGS